MTTVIMIDVIVMKMNVTKADLSRSLFLTLLRYRLERAAFAPFPLLPPSPHLPHYTHPLFPPLILFFSGYPLGR